MGFFDKISRGISRGIGNAVGKATQKAVEKKATEALAPKINQAADAIAGTNTSGDSINKGALDSALGNFANAVSGYASQTAQNLKICPKCNTPAAADKKFCPECGEALPEKTLGESAVCGSCGKQNAITEKFCSGCGAKLPIAIEAEEKQLKDDQSVLDEWKEKLGAYPVWTLGGSNYYLELYDSYYSFSAKYASYEKAHRAVDSYREILQQNGFRTAGQYPSVEHLYKKVGDVCYHVDTEHCFEGDSDRPMIGFNVSEPTGGFDYEKPKPKKKGLFGLFK